MQLDLSLRSALPPRCTLCRGGRSNSNGVAARLATSRVDEFRRHKHVLEEAVLLCERVVRWAEASGSIWCENFFPAEGDASHPEPASRAREGEVSEGGWVRSAEQPHACVSERDRERRERERERERARTLTGTSCRRAVIVRSSAVFSNSLSSPHQRTSSYPSWSSTGLNALSPSLHPGQQQ